MINLAGVKDCDKTILEELYLARLTPIKVDKSNGEVPYSFIAKVGNFFIRRAWYYWIANSEVRESGLFLDDAMKLHNKIHPTNNSILGNTIRAGGHAGGISPDDYVSSPVYNSDLTLECKKLGIETQSQKSMGIGEDETEYPKLNLGEMAKLCNEGKIKAKRYVKCYHIDDQISLNEFSEFIRSIK